MKPIKFHSRKRVGLLLRVFASKEEQISDRVAMVEEAIKAVEVGPSWISRVDVLVWSDQRYAGSDCGKTAAVLREKFSPRAVQVHEVHCGDLFCGILNYGVAVQSRAGIDYSMVLSAEAFSYLTPPVLEKIVEAACDEKLAIGVAISELQQSVREGRLANTFCMWHNISLQSVGGFDLRAAKPVDDRLAHYMHGWSAEKGDVFYQLAGVEEVIPCARLVETFGSCLAAVIPPGGHYEVPDPVKTPDLYLRHISKMGTKTERQSAFLAMVGYDLSFLKGGVTVYDV